MENSKHDLIRQSVENAGSESENNDNFSQITSFAEGNFPEFINKAFEKQGYLEPTPIQSQVWPVALKGCDVVGIAQTGSGKTLAFGVPALLHIYAKERTIRNDMPTVLILAPTRELVQQINNVITDFIVGSSILNVCIFGGASKGSQLCNIARGCNILISTPGRLIDFLEYGNITLQGCTFLVLDEADRMLDMGFEPQIRKILHQITLEHQTLMFSATWPQEVKSLAEEFLKNYVQVTIGAKQLSANHNIKQYVDIIEEAEKDEKLLKLVKDIMNETENKTIIFASTKIRVSELTHNLKAQGFPAMCMHGNKSQDEREYALKRFRDGSCPILVATDVAARGLDVDDVKYVINLDYPNSSEDYVHRIGRTARVNNSGTAYTFFTFQDMKQAEELVNILTEAKQDINPVLLNLVEMSKTFGYGKGRSLGACSFGSGRYVENVPKHKERYPKKDWNSNHSGRNYHQRPRYNEDNRRGYTHRNNYHPYNERNSSKQHYDRY
ncbi:probable ATP-dependent RNA helicase DDX17 [Nephila pilipes]|uniref:RNA helicase n=1 Tax=Nephila pilipes TaxID=299642 RepID=A0A8X6U328_NEPPI|nr:probable ATP-dependent RNA helicase DDX17 [Nephila pilipes]GFT75251.1 probable ATP-dependent RNA helicase DDX17 [Nephila pilipes]